MDNQCVAQLVDCLNKSCNGKRGKSTKRGIKRWNRILHLLFNIGFLTGENGVEIWRLTTPKQKQHEYFKGTKFESEYPPDPWASSYEIS